MDLINRDELLKKQTVYYDYNGEKVGVVRVSDIVEAPDLSSTEPKLATTCNQLATDCISRQEVDRNESRKCTQ